MSSVGFLYGAVFLTAVVILYLGCFRWRRPLLGYWLLFLASLAFYGWWQPQYLPLLLLSLLCNFGLALSIGTSTPRWKRAELFFGIALNLLVLVHYKYGTFFAELFQLKNHFASAPEEGSAAPLGLSFWTFFQIAFLVDVYRGTVRDFSFIQYALTATFFPKILSGPITRMYEMTGLDGRPFGESAPTSRGIAEGLTLLALGLFKKTVLADSLDTYSTPVFHAAAQGSIGAVWAWSGVLAYFFQLYFDFSGYTDIALGVGRMFGFQLPENFNSPYKASSVIEFWRRWHITFSRFLRDYLYIPLGGNKKGRLRQYANLLVVMMLGGFWHGASWTFVVWGALHGTYLAINHAWRQSGLSCPAWLSRILTFAAISYAWVWFRADDTPTALRMTRALFGLDGVTTAGNSWNHALLDALQTPVSSFEAIASALDDLGWFPSLPWNVSMGAVLVSPAVMWTLLIALSVWITWALPNSQQWTFPAGTAQAPLSAKRAMAVGLLYYWALALSYSAKAGTFTYFQF
jgi:D-alanyl-lipoteichoic acid acyltransferase DltB (MBOAT superfamily)